MVLIPPPFQQNPIRARIICPQDSGKLRILWKLWKFAGANFACQGAGGQMRPQDLQFREPRRSRGPEAEVTLWVQCMR